MRGHIATREKKDRDGNTIGKLYYCVYFHEGRHRWKAAGPSKKKAEIMLSKILSEIDDGAYAEVRDMSFDRYARKWLKEKELAVRRSTYDSYVGHVHSTLIPHFGAKSLKKITYANCKDFVAKELAAGKISPSTAKKHLRTLSAIFKEAMKEGYLKQNPAANVTPPKVEKKRHEMLTPDEMQRFLEHVDPHHKIVFLTLILTGARLGEILALPWKNIDFKESTVKIAQTLYKGQVEEKTKSESSRRDIVMPDVLLGLLRSHQIQALAEGRYGPDALVFVNKAGTPIDSKGLNKYFFKTALARAGIEKQTRIHDLRHAFASHMYALGEDITYISEQLGHSSPYVTMSIYAHSVKKHKHETAERLSNKLLGSEVAASNKR